MAWKDGVVDKLNGGVAALLKRAKVRVVAGLGDVHRRQDLHGRRPRTATVTITAEHVILATGSMPVELPFLPFGGDVISSTEALALPELPKKLVVVGAGYIGLELGIAFRKLGCEVTVVEALDRILPLYDARAGRAGREMAGDERRHRASGRQGEGLDGRRRRSSSRRRTARPRRLPADKILVTVGRKPAHRRLGPGEHGASTWTAAS